MSDVQTLKSYLVGLGFDVNAQQYKKFESTLADAARSVQKETATIGLSMLKWQTAIVGMFGAVSVAILGTIDKVANADQEYRLFGERMFMSTQNARSLKIALDALGQPLEAIAFDPELHNRFIQLQHDQKVMSGGLGGDFESNMRQIRDFTFELTRLKVELQYLAMGTVNEIFKALGTNANGVLETLRGWNNWIVNNIPYLSKQFATYLVPILKDTWRIVKDIVVVTEELATDFTNVISVLSGDSSIATTTFNFEKFASAIEKTIYGLDKVLEAIIGIEAHAPLLEVLGGALAGGAVGTLFGPGGALIGAGIGGAVGLAFGGLAHLGASNAASGPSVASAGLADQARTIAKRVAADTGADPALIFAQFAHETGNFTNRGATQLNNLAGIRIPGTTTYKSYGSFDDFANDYEKVITEKRYAGLTQARTPEQFAHIAKGGGYYGDLESNYSRGMRNALPSYGGGSTTHVSVGDINVMQPNASASEIAKQVTDTIAEKQGKQTQRNLAMFTPAFQ